MIPRAPLLLLGALAARASAAPAVPPKLDPASAAPYFSSGPAADAMRRFRVEDWAGAAQKLDEYLAAHEKAPDREQAAFVAAYALSRAGRFADAARRFDGLVKSYPLLADYHRVYAARALLAAKKYADALDRASAVSDGAVVRAEAAFARADALAALGRSADAAAAFQAYLDAWPKSWREPEARLHLAEAEEALGAKQWPAAREGYRWLFIHHPTEPPAKRAEARLAARDAAALKLSGPEQLTRGLALFEAMRNPESEAALTAALAAHDLDDKQRCAAAYHLAQSVFKQRNRPRAAPLFDDAANLCARIKNDPDSVDLHMKSLYQGGRCHAARGEGEIAAQKFAEAEAAHPTHSYADDARLRGAEAYTDLAIKARKGPLPDGGVGADDWDARAAALLADLADRYPTGDVRSEALFRLFFRAWRKGALDEARRSLDTALAKVPREEGWWDAGRTLYWVGRVAEKSGRIHDARASWTRCAREYPLSYYALQSLNRLREVAPDEEKKLVAELRAPAATPADLAWTFAPRPLFGEPGFARGVELARLGFGAEAKRELAALGIKPPEKGAASGAARAASGPTDGDDLLWLATVLYDRAGEYAISHWIPRHTLTSYARAWPVGDNRKRWLLSYPRGYADLIVEHAAKNGQPEALQFAIVREESAFDPLTESFANAVGLTQLTPPPAKRWSQGLPFTREALRDPAVNVTIGARELGYLWHYFDGNPAFTIAGYNAGEGAVLRWAHAAPPDETLDAFIESIPFDETRGYTKRVLASYFAYHWIYATTGDPVPPLPHALPAIKKH
jgi:soluble lytic murein transglycosylase